MAMPPGETCTGYYNEGPCVHCETEAARYRVDEVFRDRRRTAKSSAGRSTRSFRTLAVDPTKETNHAR